MKRIAFCLLFLGSCTREPSHMKGQVLARVNGHPVFYEEFLTDYQQLRAEHDEISLKNPRILEQLKTRAFNEVVVLRLLRQEAAKRHLRIPKEGVEGRLANWKDGYPPGGFEEMLRKQSTSEDYLKKRIEDQLLIEKIASELSTEEVLISDDDMRKHYKQHEKEFYRPERVHVFQIVVPTVEEAQKVRQEILSNKITFESAARQYSLSPDAAKGGDLGIFARNEKIEAFNEAFGLPVGSISRPVQSRYGVHLLKVVERMPEKNLSYEEAKNEVHKKLKKTHEVRIYNEWLTKLLKDAEIYRNDVLFASNR